MKLLSQEICINIVSLSETLKQRQDSVTTRKSNVRAKAEKL